MEPVKIKGTVKRQTHKVTEIVRSQVLILLAYLPVAQYKTVRTKLIASPYAMMSPICVDCCTKF